MQENIKASILITSYKRPNLLYWGLHSIARQTCKYPFEVIVLNDGTEDETEEICKSFSDLMNIKYVFTGHRNIDGEKWRVPGFAFNVGAKLSRGEILFLSCAEMFHMGNSIEEMISILESNNRSIVTCNGRDDLNKRFLDKVSSTNGNVTDSDFNMCGNLQDQLPFFLCFYKNPFMEIGGYDEDFVGLAYDDNDIMDRLKKVIPGFIRSNSKCVHLWHERFGLSTNEIKTLYNLNKRLYETRINIIVRNSGKEWGVNI